MISNTRHIYKTLLPREPGAFLSDIPPEDILSFQCQGDSLAIWHYGDDKNIKLKFEYCLFFTGHKVDIEMWKHIGTTQDMYDLVWHLFYDISKALL